MTGNQNLRRIHDVRSINDVSILWLQISGINHFVYFSCSGVSECTSVGVMMD
jgi:hypothetical protein